MKKISIFLSILLMGSLLQAQSIPSNVPTNGLVGWWPFNGNANDESGNGNHGTVNGATMTTDRFGNSNGAYNFNGFSNSISVPHSPILNTTEFTISLWFNKTGMGFNSSQDWFVLLRKGTFHPFALAFEGITFKVSSSIYNGMDFLGINSTTITNEQIWYNTIATYSAVNNGTIKIYLNGVLEDSIMNVGTPNINSQPISIGGGDFNQVFSYFKGYIDDIGIWNRSLSEQEISLIHNVNNNCANNLSISPANLSQNTGSNATLNATTSDPNPSYVWQSDLGLGFQNLSNYGQYSGVNSDSLVVANLQLRNHQQAFRVISTSGNCVDTSAVALLSLSDTCVQTLYDTSLVTVTDTLLINITGIGNPAVANTLKAYPNPTAGMLYINTGNFAAMNGYSIRINNSAGQLVFEGPINQALMQIPLPDFGSAGLYYLRVNNPAGAVITTRKIVLQ